MFLGAIGAILVGGVLVYPVWLPMLDKTLNGIVEPAPLTEVLPVEELVQERTVDDFVEEVVERFTGNPVMKPVLNLALPDIDWEKQAWKESHLTPDYFSLPKDQDRVNVSGALFFDESEEARQLPIQDTIQGGEIHLRVLIP